jgi:cell division septal protein FtsQ
MTEKGRKRRGNSRFVFFFILILLVLGSITWASYLGLSRAKWLNIKRINIIGNENVASSTIQSMLHEYIGENLVDISAKDIRNQLLKLKRIERVKILRLFPSTLKIKVTERKGFLYVKTRDGDLFPIDDKGMVMEYAVYPSKEDMPIVHTQYQTRQLHAGSVIKDSFLKKVIALQKQIITEKPEFMKSISEYYLDNGLLTIVDAKYGTRVILNQQDLADQIRRYQFVQENGDINRDNILDMRFKNQVIVRAGIQ